MYDSCQLSGMKLKSNTDLNNEVKGSLKKFRPYLRISLQISSGPDALLFFRPISALLTSVRDQIYHSSLLFVGQLGWLSQYPRNQLLFVDQVRRESFLESV
jgi:hypothetical protein